MIYIEYGIDFDNNRFGLGRSVEVEMPNSTERRCKAKVKLKDKAYYFRLWIGWRVLVVSKKGVEWCKKSRPNFKLVFGVKGQDKSLPAEVVVIPYQRTEKGEFLYGCFLCNGDVYWAAITGGVEAAETPLTAAMRETFEEAGITPDKAHFIELTACANTPAEWIDPTYQGQALLIPESCFGVDATGLDIHLSSEHADFKWLPYHTATMLYRYDLHKIALWELNRRLQNTQSKGAQQ